MKRLSYIGLLLYLFVAWMEAQSVSLPTPVEYSQWDGFFVTSTEGKMVTNDKRADKICEAFKKQLEEITLHQVVEPGIVSFKLIQEMNIPSEGYVLNINKDTA